MSEAPRHVHFIGIGGVGMGSLAGLLAARGVRVTGSDTGVYPPMSTALERWGIPVLSGFRPEHVLERPPDLVVIGNVVRADNPEARAAIDEGLHHLSFSDALYELAIAGKHPVVIAGTHGKTTTTSLVAALLHACGRDPSLLVGGHSHDFDGSFREGGGEHFVVEGDEYDTAFFDKTPKFLHYGARTLVVTSVEFDHADIYRDLDHVKEAFRTLVSRMPADGTIVAALDHSGVSDVVADAPCRVIAYGVEAAGASAESAAAAAGWRATALAVEGAATCFDVKHEGAVVARARAPLFGRFNVENALAAVAVTATLGVPARDAIAALEGFRGVRRRQEVRGEARGVVVIDDFAHHPTAVRGSIEAVRDRFPDRRIVAVFEPRTNTSRRAIFQDDYARALAPADRVVICAVPDSPIYSVTGPVSERFSADRLAAALSATGVEACALPDVPAIVERLARECEPGDLVLCMSNGSFDDIWQRLLDALSSREGSA